MRETLCKSVKVSDPPETLPPPYAHHTFRRTADRMARDAMAETGASKEDIDDLFGWLQAQRAKDQQKAYAGIAERSVRTRCTMMI